MKNEKWEYKIKMESRRYFFEFLEELETEIKKISSDNDIEKINFILENTSHSILNLIRENLEKDGIYLDKYWFIFKNTEITKEDLLKYKLYFNGSCQPLYIKTILDNETIVNYLLTDSKIFTAITNVAYNNSDYLLFVIKNLKLKEVLSNEEIIYYSDKNINNRKIVNILWNIRSIDYEHISKSNKKKMVNYLIKVFKDLWDTFTKEEREEVIKLLFCLSSKEIDVKILDIFS